VRELKDEHQQPIEQQHSEPMPALVGVARVGNPSQAGEQGGQLAAQDAHLSAHRRRAGLLLCGDGGLGRAGIGQRYGGAGEQSRLAPLLAQRLLLLFLVTALRLDLGALRAAAGFAHGRGLPATAPSRARQSALRGLTHTWRGVLRSDWPGRARPHPLVCPSSSQPAAR